MISIVIPYFQRQPGVLRRSLDGVRRQQPCGLPVHLIVVDDESPSPVEDEFSDLDLGDISLEIVHQRNGGPGAARNRGLDCVPAQTRYVAFLDSDDVWADDHLARAVLALESGHDAFFGNHLQLGQTTGAFERGRRLQMNQHPALPAAPELHEFRGDMFDQILRGNVIGTSTVVFRRLPFRTHRFRTDLTSAGEDYLFWMGLAQAGARFCFSTQVAATYGRGVNVYSGVEWASDAYFIRLRHEMAYRKATRTLFALSAEQSGHIRRCIQQLRGEFAAALANRLRHGPKLTRQLLREQWGMDPISLWASPFHLLSRRFAG